MRCLNGITHKNKAMAINMGATQPEPKAKDRNGKAPDAMKAAREIKKSIAVK